MEDVFPVRLRAARDLKKLSREELAEKAGIPVSSIAHLETGSRKPSFDTLRRLANALAVSTDYLIGRTDQPELVKDADPLYRDFDKLTGRDREIAKDFLKVLADRNRKGDGDDNGEET